MKTGYNEKSGQQKKIYPAEIQKLTPKAAYEAGYDNICRVLLRHFLGSALIGKKIGETIVSRDYEELKEEIISRKKERLEELLAEVLEVLIRQQYEGDEKLFWYLRQDIRDFTVELSTAAEEGKLERVVRL